MPVFISWKRSALFHWNKIHNKTWILPTPSTCPSLFSHGYLKWHKEQISFTFKDKIVHLLPVFFVLYNRKIYLKTLTNLLPSLKFYGKLGTAEINGKFLLQGFSGFDSSHMEFARKSQLWFGLCWRVCLLAGRIPCNRDEDPPCWTSSGVTQRINRRSGLKSVHPDIQRGI